MRYLKKYKTHNESIRSTIAGIGLAGSLLTTSPDAISKPIESSEQVQSLPIDATKVYKMVDELSKIRIQKSEDSDLNLILDEIKSNIQNEDPQKLQKIFSKLSNHLQGNYGFKVGIEKVEDFEKKIDNRTEPTELNLFSILGWLGSVCLAICGVPQAIQSFKDKHSHGISWGFLLLWTFGEIFALAYVYDKLDLPLLVNYGSNILIVSIMLYYKVYPKTKSESP
jgi:uncharacterized protein with PQ loop repeat